MQNICDILEDGLDTSSQSHQLRIDILEYLNTRLAGGAVKGVFEANMPEKLQKRIDIYPALTSAKNRRSYEKEAT